MAPRVNSEPLLVGSLPADSTGAARIFEAGVPGRALVEMKGGLMLIKAISGGSSLAVLAARECDAELVSYEMTLLVEAAGEVLTPAIRSQPGV